MRYYPTVPTERCIAAQAHALERAQGIGTDLYGAAAAIL